MKRILDWQSDFNEEARENEVTVVRNARCISHVFDDFSVERILKARTSRPAFFFFSNRADKRTENAQPRVLNAPFPSLCYTKDYTGVKIRESCSRIELSRIVRREDSNNY